MVTGIVPLLCCAVEERMGDGRAEGRERGEGGGLGWVGLCCLACLRTYRRLVSL